MVCIIDDKIAEKIIQYMMWWEKIGSGIIMSQYGLHSINTFDRQDKERFESIKKQRKEVLQYFLKIKEGFPYIWQYYGYKVPFKREKRNSKYIMPEQMTKLRELLKESKEPPLKTLRLIEYHLREIYKEKMGLSKIEDGLNPAKRVFIVHGHDVVLKNELELFLISIDLEPIVLHRQADKGMTIIEKFEEYSDVRYAIVTMTPDDTAYPTNQETLPDIERTKEYRARQNVIFEFGCFAGNRSQKSLLYLQERCRNAFRPERLCI